MSSFAAFSQVLTFVRPSGGYVDVEDLAASQVVPLPHVVTAINCHTPQGGKEAHVKEDYGRGDLLRKVTGHEE